MIWASQVFFSWIRCLLLFQTAYSCIADNIFSSFFYFLPKLPGIIFISLYLLISLHLLLQLQFHHDVEVLFLKFRVQIMAIAVNSLVDCDVRVYTSVVFSWNLFGSFILIRYLKQVKYYFFIWGGVVNVNTNSVVFKCFKFIYLENVLPLYVPLQSTSFLVLFLKFCFDCHFSAYHASPIRAM